MTIKKMSIYYVVEQFLRTRPPFVPLCSRPYEIFEIPHTPSLFALKLFLNANLPQFLQRNSFQCAPFRPVHSQYNFQFLYYRTKNVFLWEKYRNVFDFGGTKSSQKKFRWRQEINRMFSIYKQNFAIFYTPLVTTSTKYFQNYFF